MKIDIDNIFNGLKRLSPALIALFCTSAFVVFAPEQILVKLGIQDLPLYVTQIVGGVFLLSFALIISILAFSVKKSHDERRAVRNMERMIEELTPEELLRVLIMYHSPGNTLSMSINDGITSSLSAKRIVVHGSNISDGIGFMSFPFILQPWAVRYIKKHRDEYNISFEDIEKERKRYVQNLKNWVIKA